MVKLAEDPMACAYASSELIRYAVSAPRTLYSHRCGRSHWVGAIGPLPVSEIASCCSHPLSEAHRSRLAALHVEIMRDSPPPA